jgi:hypothetical protein
LTQPKYRSKRRVRSVANDAVADGLASADDAL